MASLLSQAVVCVYLYLLPRLCPNFVPGVDRDTLVTVGLGCLGVKTQRLGKYLSQTRRQIGSLETCEPCHGWIDRHHQSKDFGVHVIASKITGEIRGYVVYTGVYGYGLGGVGQ
ncbi:hypothetical protein DSO57_1019400 [Entomophthora muscae]|uniref:Uncharacterized protein n=1 Tax=Entomophthora muscae TaxID=34485 RepID=A0ACC2UED8_9FUNG|nr:hypothetical protein DSO57_1019400 [Entomophthora muscae]